ncbi:LacI family DNA-binding transcriptional regulator [Paucilactobacillus hokkaidonensis]
MAKLAGVSHTTVSRALNDSVAVKMETKQRIRAIADELGYVPNLNAKGLANQHSYLIGVFFSNLEIGTSSSFLAEVIDEINKNIPSEYSVSINSINKDTAQVLQKFDGVLIVSQSNSDDHFIDQMVQRKLPLVVLNREIERSDVSNLAADEYIGAKNITEYAIRLGHTRFGFIKGLSGFASTDQRQNGFYDALDEHQLNIDPDFVKEGNYLPKSGYAAMRAILAGSTRPTCVFCANDDMTIGAIRACSDLGYRVPEDISIFGYDDMRYSKYLIPALTTVHKPTGLIAERGIKLLTQMLASDEEIAPIKEVIDPTPIVRNSVQDLR